ncbi:MAG: hypothetical protein P4L28_04790 [Paludibacteraceae bacterium]|nr:hypothetical protein [Paludibacteraceae bacterium]
MKRFLVFIPFAILLGACAPKTYNSMIWQPTPVAIDGKADGWGTPLRYYDKNSKLFYEIKNDRENIYIAFSANENDIIMRAKQRGVKIAIDTLYGKDDYPAAITFPVHKGRPMGMRPDMMSKQDMPQQPDSSFHPKEMNNRPRMTPSIKLTGWGGKEADTISAKGNQYGIEAEMLNDPKSFFFELKIPFSSLYKRTIVASDTTKAIFFEVTLEASRMGDIQMPKGGGPGSLDNGGAPGGFGGGDMPSGPPPGGGGGFGGDGEGHGGRRHGGSGEGSGMPRGEGMNQSNQTPSIFRFELRPTFQ